MIRIRKILIAVFVISALVIYAGFLIRMLEQEKNGLCDDIIELNDGTIINCKKFLIHDEVLTYRDCNYNKIIIPLVNIKSMKVVKSEKVENE